MITMITMPIMTKLAITAYKNSGKFYGEKIIETHSDIELYEEQVMAELIAKSGVPLPTDGFIVVDDLPGGTGFHKHLYRANDLIELLKSKGN